MTELKPCPIRYEQPPVDRKLLCAREAAAECGEGPAGWGDRVRTAIRAIELFEEGFGK